MHRSVPAALEIQPSASRHETQQPRRRKTVLITGCDSGIGEDAAKVLASKGWTVFATVIEETSIEKLRSYDTVNLRPIVMDLTQPEQIENAVEIVRDAVGEAGLDALINNAGRGIGGAVEFNPIERCRRQFQINLFGPIQLIQATMPLIRTGEPGRIVNIGSLASDQNIPHIAAYSGTKAALHTISESLRREVARFGIKVVLIRPGPVLTRSMDTVKRSQDEWLAEMSPDCLYFKYYGADAERSSYIVEAFRRAATTPDRVSKRIYQALTVKKPKNVYFDTLGTHLTFLAISWLPNAWYDAFMRKLWGIKKTPPVAECD